MQIKTLALFTKNLKEQREFYEKTLGLSVENPGDSGFVVKIGYSKLQFSYKADAKPYHVAFHISAEKENEALTWLKDRVALLKMGGQEIIDFSSWNARSLYFYDAGNNVVEFISRRHLFTKPIRGFKSAGPEFFERDIRGIAEIGLATTNILPVYEELHSITALDQYSGDLEKFCPIGDDRGLLIAINNRKKKTWFPTRDRAQTAVFQLDFSHQGKDWEMTFDGQYVRLDKK